MDAAEEVALSGNRLDRQAERRAQSQDLLAKPSARIAPMWRGRPLVSGSDAARLVLLPVNEPFLSDYSGETIFLGDRGEGPLFAQDVSEWNPDSGVALDVGPGRAGDDQPATGIVSAPEGARFADLRGLLPSMASDDAEVAVAAKGVIEWHRSHRFCARCGGKSEPADGGWRRDCPACGASHFPRTDPVVIMLVTDGNHLLVGRSPGWPEGFYSLLAGFMEPGETVSAAVRREVLEEAGIRIGMVRLLASQPWPFPASLMIGCLARAESREITLDPAELEDALWVSREEMLTVFAGQHPRLGTPRPGSIAHFLIKMWLADRLD